MTATSTDEQYDDANGVRAAAFRYFSPEMRRLGVACTEIAEADLIPDGWTLEVSVGFVTAVDDYQLHAVRIRESDHPGHLPNEWYGTYKTPSASYVRPVEGTGPVETFRRAVSKYHAQRETEDARARR